MFKKILQYSQGNALGLRNFQQQSFYRTSPVAASERPQVPVTCGLVGYVTVEVGDSKPWSPESVT